MVSARANLDNIRIRTAVNRKSANDVRKTDVTAAGVDRASFGDMPIDVGNVAG